MFPSVQHSSISPRQVRPLVLDQVEVGVATELKKIGIAFDAADLKSIAGYAQDALQATVTTGTIPNLAQFLQTWLPGFVNVITQARKIDELVGISTVGAWEDEEVVQGVLEMTGGAQPYGDHANVPLASWNPSYERRKVVRFEEGMQVGTLEEARASRQNINSAASKRESAALALEIARNRTGFYGFNNGANRTYGFLNDPSLPAYVTVAATGSGSSTTWASKSFLNITADLRAAFSGLRTQSGDTIDPESTEITLGIATACVDFLSVTSDFGVSIRDWIKTTYPKTRVVSAPELNSANGGANVFYLYAERVADSSTDDGLTFAQVVPAKFRLLGTEKRAKGYIEDYSNATAGVILKRPYAVKRYTGI